MSWRVQNILSVVFVVLMVALNAVPV